MTIKEIIDGVCEMQRNLAQFKIELQRARGSNMIPDHAFKAKRVDDIMARSPKIIDALTRLVKKG